MDYNKKYYQDDYHNPYDDQLVKDSEKNFFKKETEIDFLSIENDIYEEIDSLIQEYRLYDSRFDHLTVSDILNPVEEIKTRCRKDTVIFRFSERVIEILNLRVSKILKKVLHNYGTLQTFFNSEEGKNCDFMYYFHDYDFRVIYYNVFKRFKKMTWTYKKN